VNIALWVVQIILASIYAIAGVMKITKPKDELLDWLPWVEDFSPRTVKVIAVAVLLGAAGLVLPAATGIATIRTPMAATGLGIMMALAIGTHVRRREPDAGAFTAVLLVLAVFVAWGRSAPTPSRSEPRWSRCERPDRAIGGWWHHASVDEAAFRSQLAGSVSGVDGPAGFEQEGARAVLGDRLVFDAFGHDVDLAGRQGHIATGHANGQFAIHHEEELVGVWVGVLRELPLRLEDPHVVVVDGADGSRCPGFIERG
jgi:uncharacterized membrane protein YphA (DoxX/SURF4 family)